MRCDYCLKWFHCKCVNSSDEQYNHLRELGGDVNFWFCRSDKKKVVEFIKKGKSEDTILHELKKGIECIRSEVLKINAVVEEKFETSKKSFAEVLKSNNSVMGKTVSTKPKVNKGVIVAHKSHQMSSKEIERLVKDKVDLVKIKTGISKLKHVRNSGVFLGTCCDTDILKKEIMEKLGEDFTVSKPKEPTPQLIISGLSREYTSEELWQEIKETNHGFNSADTINVVHQRKKHHEDKRESWYYILEAPPTTFKKLLNRYLSIDFKDHYVKEYIEITRCYNCQQYNHKSSGCLSPPTFCRCGKDHKTSECARKVSYSCANCRAANLKGARYNTNHSCGSKLCTIHQNILKMKRERIDVNNFLQ